MNILIILFGLFSAGFAWSRVDAEFSRAGSGENFSNIVSLGYSLNTFVDEDTDLVGVNHYLGYVFTDSQSKTNLNANLADFLVITKGHELSYSVTFSESLTLTAGAEIMQFNEDEAQADGFSGGLYYQFEKVQVGFNYSEAMYKQKRKTVIATVDVTDRIKFKQKVQSVYLDYQWTESLLLKLNAAAYSYQTYGNTADLNAFSNTSTGIIFLNAAGPSMADQASSQVRNSAELGFLYNFSDNWLMDLNLQTSTDELTPNAKTNGIGLGLEYTNTWGDVIYSLTGSVNTYKTENVDGNSSTGLFAIGFSY